MQGVIYVEEFMRQQEHLQEWQARLQRNVEWYALKEYWRATTEHEKQEVERLYGEVLNRGLRKYKERFGGLT